MSLPSFGVRNPVPANLLMLAAIAVGIYSAFSLRREFFPEVEPDTARVAIIYPGASPEEIEESIVYKVEDALADVDEVKRIRTSVTEGSANVLVEFEDGTDISKAVDEIERVVDRLQDLPSDAERIQVLEIVPNMPVININLWADVDEEILKRGIRVIEDDLKSMPRMGSMLQGGVREYEIRVNVDSDSLLKHGISLPEVAGSINAWMAEIPSGTLKTEGGNINVRAIGVVERSDEIGEIVIRASPDGSMIRLQDVAEVVEDYVEIDVVRRFNGFPSVGLTVFREGKQDAIEISEMVKAYVAGRNREPFSGSPLGPLLDTSEYQAWSLGTNRTEALPAKLTTSTDLARFIEGRLDLLLNNAFQGAFLVFIALFLVLNVRTATWVMVGLFGAVCGTLAIMFLLDLTLNLLTMFGLLVTLGMLTDDAIVVAENIQSRANDGESAEDAAINGGNEVVWPVLATVSTTIVAFLPLLFIQGQIGALMGALPWVVFCALLASYIESVLILPTHMAHSLGRKVGQLNSRVNKRLERWYTWRDEVVIGGAVDAYSKFTRYALHFRYITTAFALAILIGSIGLVTGGRVPFEFLPVNDAENLMVEIKMPTGSSLLQTRAFARKIEEAAGLQPELAALSTTVGGRFDMETGSALNSETNTAQMFIELLPIEERERSSGEFIDSVRLAAGDLSDADDVAFNVLDGGPGGKDITIEITGDSRDTMLSAVGEVEAELARFDGVYGIANDDVEGQPEMRVELLPGAASLGLTVADIAMQLRASLFGIDAHVFSRNREEIDVRVRLAKNARSRLQDLEQMWIITPTGRSVPLSEVATIKESSSYTAIRRLDRRRAITVTASTDMATSPEEVYRELIGPLVDIEAKHSGLKIESGGRQARVNEAFSTLPIAFCAAIVMIYIILAWLFASYVQPFAVMLAIPFGLIGVIWGHLILGFDLTFLSLIGVVALAGVVVNNSLILIDFFNRYLAEGMPLVDALIMAGRKRLRPIVLTTATTVLGLSPLMLEQSFQARFLIPMAISITAGLISSTGLTLIVLPAIIVIIDDFKGACHWAWYGRARPTDPDSSTKSMS
ncbi:MAG: efflux RND transporter permease subunit [Phycisphaerales bacterium]|nr:efflux RND transporter permease subunit [Phycisphaerales bacterium]